MKVVVICLICLYLSASVLAQCSFNEYLVDSQCLKCNEQLPGCIQCQKNQCLGCSEGLYLANVEGVNVCTKSCSLLTQTSGTRYYASHFERICYECDEDCELCMDNIGCVSQQTISDCHSSCEECTKAQEASKCIKCAAGTYLHILEPSLPIGECLQKNEKEDNDDILIYLSNTAQDIENDQIGGLSSDVTINFMQAIQKAKEARAMYSTKANGEEITVKILLYKGDHFIIDIDTYTNPQYVDFYTHNYSVEIMPYYCDGTRDPSACVEQGETVKVYNKISYKFEVEIPSKLVIENIQFDMLEGLIPFQDDVASSLTLREKVCSFDSETEELSNVNPDSVENCQLRVPVSEFCHRAPKYNMFKFVSYGTDEENWLTKAPTLVIKNSSFTNVFYEINSFIDLNTGGHVYISDSTFSVSNCGSIIKNTNPGIANQHLDDAAYTKYIGYFNLGSDEAVMDYSQLTDFSIEIVGSQFFNFGQLKPIIISGASTNPLNGAEHRGLILHLKNFYGHVTMTDNFMQNIKFRTKGCWDVCDRKRYGRIGEVPYIYGTEDVDIKTYLLYLNQVHGNVTLSNHITNCTASSNLIFINSSNKFLESQCGNEFSEGCELQTNPVLLNHNTVTYSGTFRLGGIIRIIKQASNAFVSAQASEQEKYLRYGLLHPCSDLRFNGNTITHIASCAPSFPQISFECLQSDGASVSLNVPENVVNDIAQSWYNGSNYFDNQDLSFDLDISSNVINHALNNFLAPFMYISGFLSIMSIKHDRNEYSDNGKYLYLKRNSWGNLDDNTNFVDCSATYAFFQESYGFIKIRNSGSISITNCSINNLFYLNTRGKEHLMSDFASFLTLENNYGVVSIVNNKFTSLKGFLTTVDGVPVINELVPSNYLLPFGYSKLNPKFHCFIPVIKTSSTNHILTLNVSNTVFNDSISYMTGSTFGGSFIHLDEQSGVKDVAIYNLTASDIYIYGGGGMIARYGNLSINGMSMSDYNSDPPLKDSTFEQGAPIELVLEYDQIGSFSHVDVFGSVFLDKSLILLEAASQIKISEIKNLVIESLSISGCISLGSIFFLDHRSLNVAIDTLIVNNAITQDGALYITGMEKISISNSLFTNTSGGVGSELTIIDCEECEVTITNSSFSKDPAIISETNDKNGMVYASNSGNLDFISCKFSHSQNVSQGGVIRADNTDIQISDSQFWNNSAIYGGVIYVTENSEIKISNSTFDQNEAFENSGAILVKNRCQLEFMNCTFTNNTSSTAAVFGVSQYSTVKDVDSVYSGNVATKKVAIGEFSRSGENSFSGSKFFNNKANEGILLDLSNSNITLSDVQIYNNTFEAGNKNIFAVSSRVEMTNCCLNGDKAISNNITNGGYLTLYDSIGELNQCQFSNGFGQYGGAIYLSASTLTAQDTKFLSNEANLTGGAIFVTTSSKMDLNNCTFQNNKAAKGDAIELLISNEYSSITSCHFESRFAPQYINAEHSSLSIMDSNFTIDYTDYNHSRSVKDGAGVKIDSTVRLTAINNRFEHLQSSGGAIHISDSVTGIDLSGIYGSISDPNDLLVKISHNSFYNLTANENGGAAIHFNSKLKGSMLDIENNTFSKCFSHTSGGALYYTFIKPNETNNHFSNNSARIYGENIASASAHKLKFVSHEFYNANIDVMEEVKMAENQAILENFIQGQRSGGALDQTNISTERRRLSDLNKEHNIYIGLFDFYGNLVKTIDNAPLVLTIEDLGSNKIVPTLTGNFVFYSQRGLFKVDNTSAIAEPGTTQTIYFKTDAIDRSIPSNAKYLQDEGILDTDYNLRLTVNFRLCQAGEELHNNGECRVCEAGKEYSILPFNNQTKLDDCTTQNPCPECKPCQIMKSTCFGGNLIAPKGGYWRESEDSENFIECLSPDVCPAYNGTEEQLYGLCTEGYEGPLCGNCQPGYAKTRNGNCDKCSSKWTNIIYHVSVLLLVFLFLLAINLSSIKITNEKRDETAIYFKLLINHFQILSIIYEFKSAWSGEYSPIFSIANFVGDTFAINTSFDCLIDSRSSGDLNSDRKIPLYFYNVIFNACLPIIIFCGCFVISLLCVNYKYFKRILCCRRAKQETAPSSPSKRKLINKVAPVNGDMTEDHSKKEHESMSIMALNKSGDKLLG